MVDTVIMMPDEYEQGLAAAEPMELGAGVDENTLAGLFYTGGTTGASKGVMLSHRNLVANAQNYMMLAPTTWHDVHLYINTVIPRGRKQQHPWHHLVRTKGNHSTSV